MTVAQLDKPPVLLGGRNENQNGLRFFELLLKGFCPTIIVDRVDVHDEELVSHDTSPVVMLSKKQQQRVAAASASKVDTPTPTTSARTSISSTSGSRHVTISTPPRSNKRSRPANQVAAIHHSHHEKPFEIGERPPSDVIGISKKIWEGFCYNPLQKKDHTTPPPHKGFCSLWVDHLACFSDEHPPDGEECSVGSSDSSTCGCSVDLSPQSSPRNLQQQQSASFDYDDQDLYLLDYDDEEEEYPIAEFEDQRSYRGTHVLLMTLFALYATLFLLRSTGHANVHFALENRHHDNHNVPRSITFAISAR